MSASERGEWQRRVTSVFAVSMAALALVSCSHNVGATSPSSAPTGQPEPVVTAPYDPTATTPKDAPLTPSVGRTGKDVPCADTPLPTLPPDQFTREGIRKNLWSDFNNFDYLGNAIATDGHIICTGS